MTQSHWHMKLTITGHKRTNTWCMVREQWESTGKNEAGRLTQEQWGHNDRQREGIENKYLLNERLNVAFLQVLLFPLCPTLLCLLLDFNCSECYCHWELRYFFFFFKNQQLERYHVHTFCRNVTFDTATGHAWLLLYLWFLALFLWGRSE